MLKGTVTRDDRFWEGHPDVTFFDNKIFVVYRESDRHLTRSGTKIKLTWKQPGLSFCKPITVSASFDRYNCPRLSVVNEKLWIVCDEVKQGDYIRTENDESQTKVLLWSSSDGSEWDGPHDVGITGIVPDRICANKNGFLIATHTSHISLDSEYLIQHVWHAEGLDGPWKKHILCALQGYNFCEASICYLHQDSFIAILRENSGTGLPAYICRSTDGITWSIPIATRMFGCHRPVTGQLKSGNLLTTYREASHSFKKGYWAKNTFACLTRGESISHDLNESIILPLDHDTSSISDSGYTGWVQLPNDTIFVVNYITNDAPKPYIRWYTFNESEF